MLDVPDVHQLMLQQHLRWRRRVTIDAVIVASMLRPPLKRRC